MIRSGLCTLQLLQTTSSTPCALLYTLVRLRQVCCSRTHTRAAAASLGSADGSEGGTRGARQPRQRTRTRREFPTPTRSTRCVCATCGRCAAVVLLLCARLGACRPSTQLGGGGCRGGFPGGSGCACDRSRFLCLAGRLLDLTLLLPGHSSGTAAAACNHGASLAWRALQTPLAV